MLCEQDGIGKIQKYIPAHIVNLVIFGAWMDFRLQLERKLGLLRIKFKDFVLYVVGKKSNCAQTGYNIIVVC